LSEIALICSPNPGSILSQTASVASGVTSRGAGPVPPVVMISEQPSSDNSIKACSMDFCSSSTRRLPHLGKSHDVSSKMSRNPSSRP
jgi:hypothetical protein